jgi:hypothetical protein
MKKIHGATMVALLTLSLAVAGPVLAATPMQDGGEGWSQATDRVLDWVEAAWGRVTEAGRGDGSPPPVDLRGDKGTTAEGDLPGDGAEPQSFPLIDPNG